MATTIGKGYKVDSRRQSMGNHIPYKEWLPHADRHKVLPTTILVAKGKSGRRDKGYPFPILDHVPSHVPSHVPIQTSLSLSFYHLPFDIRFFLAKL